MNFPAWFMTHLTYFTLNLGITHVVRIKVEANQKNHLNCDVNGNLRDLQRSKHLTTLLRPTFFLKWTKAFELRAKTFSILFRRPRPRISQ